jgi:undecaprenyl-phosphate 4-deoxy-4-formamido-L-arabinose transferase
MIPRLSVIVPVYNEERSLPGLFERLYRALDNLDRAYEVILVDDGSRDASVDLLRQQFHARPDVTRVAVLASNAGQHMAILAGFELARGQFVVTLDADLQNPPEEIARIVQTMESGADYVGTVRLQRQDSWWRRRASQALNRIREKTTRIHISDQGCMLRGYDRSVVEAVNRCKEVNTFVPALAYLFARRPVEIQVAHETRAQGHSKYSLYRLIRLNFDLMTGFSLAPLEFFTLSGIAISVCSLLFVLFLAIRRFVIGPEAEGIFTLFGILFFLLGVLLFGLGVVGEYVGRIYAQVRARPRYVIGQVFDATQTDAPLASSAERRRVHIR